MTRRQLLEHLRKQRCEFVREGSRHTVYRNPTTGAQASIPRHSELGNKLATAICRQLHVPDVGR